MNFFKNSKSIKKCILYATSIILVLMQTGCQAPKQQDPITKSTFLLNTIVTITIYDSTDESILNGVVDLCKDYENRLSRTIESSEISRLNNRNGQSVFTLTKETAEVLEKGIYYSTLTDGAFDITVEPLTSLWNFTSENPVVPDSTQIASAVKKVDYKSLSLEGTELTFLSDDTKLDLGAIAKGFIADKMKDYLLENGVKSAIINLGGNILCVGSKPDGTAFKIGVQKPFKDRNETVASLEIRDYSVVSSGIYERYFEQDGISYHHILNPKTGYPYENDLISVTIISPYSVDGDGLSTSCFALGLEKGMELINSLDDIYAIFITDDYNLHYSNGAEDFIIK